MSQSESVWRLTLLPLPPASLLLALCIYFLMIVFFWGLSEHGSDACGECIDRGGKGERGRERERKGKPENSNHRVHRSVFIARVSAVTGAIKVNTVFGWVAWSFSANCWGKLTFLSAHIALSLTAFPANGRKWQQRVIRSVSMDWSLRVYFWQQTFCRQMQAIVYVEMSSLHVWSAI